MKEIRYALFAVTDTTVLAINTLKEYINIECIFDNDSGKWGNTLNGIKIRNPQELRNSTGTYCIIVTCEYVLSLIQIREQLEGLGYEKGKNVYFYKEFISRFIWEKANKIVIPYIEMMLTNACSLNCKNCGLYMNYQAKKYVRELEDLQKDIQNLFRTVDGVTSFHILGGEPLLYPKLEQLLIYITKNVKEKIGKITLVTNGTIMPDEKILDLCEEHSIEISISNYSKTLPYQKKLDKLFAVLEKRNIEFQAQRLEKWTALGNPTISRDRTGNELQKVYKECQTRCRSLYDGKLFYCGGEASMTLAGMYYPENYDYIDLIKLADGTKEERALELIQFSEGQNLKGYISFCQFCDGFGAQNTNIVLPAEQQEKELVRETNERRKV